METDKQKEERHATWLELFYDLVFVVTISQLALYLVENLTFYGYVQFLFLFIPVWWAWVGTTFFATRFYTEDISHRLLLLMQMGGAGALAVNIHGAFGDTSTGFALSYAFIRYLLVIEYYRALRKRSRDSNNKFNHPLIKRYIIGFSLAATVWAVSAFIPNLEIRYVLWILALVIDFATPITAGKLHSKFAPHVTHLSERMGLFILIVLGEMIVSIVIGMTEQNWNLNSVFVASLGLCMSFSIWWLYFSNSKGTAIQAVRDKNRISIYYAWLYGHFPLVIGISAFGAGIKYIVSVEQGELLGVTFLWIICISLSTALIAQMIIQLATRVVTRNYLKMIKKWIFFRSIFIILILLVPIIGSYYATSLFISGLITIILAIQIVVDYRYNNIKNEGSSIT